MNYTKMCLLQIWGIETHKTSSSSFKTFYIPLDIFKIYPELRSTLELCNGEKIPMEFIEPLLKLVEDLSSDDKQYIKFQELP